ncbi:MAG: TIGR00304 family membrane protein [Candidatus Methanomethylicaceae archaeon]
MDRLDKIALLLILLGAGLVIFGLIHTLSTIPPSSISGGAVIFIGPIPIFLGWGTPVEIMLILIILMVIITVLGLILFKTAR